MLDLVKAYPGPPGDVLEYLELTQDTFLIYPAADSLILLRAQDLSFFRSLSFWEAFPSSFEDRQVIKHITIDAGHKLVAASLGHLVAIWSPSAAREDFWTVHSSVNLPHQVTCLDLKGGILSVGTEKGISVYTLSLQDHLPAWTRKWTSRLCSPAQVTFSPSLTHLATFSPVEKTVRIFSTAMGRQIQNIPHPRPLRKIGWRAPIDSTRDDLILYTVTWDFALRIFLPVLDSPNHLQLHTTLDASSFTSSSQTEEKTTMVFWPDRRMIQHAVARELSKLHDEDSQSKRLKEIEDGAWDLFVRILVDRTMIIRAIANIDRRPPTLLKQFTLHHSLPIDLDLSPDSLHFMNSRSLDPEYSLTLATTPPLSSRDISLRLFLDGRKEGVHHVINAPEDPAFSVHPSKIISFARTANGTGLAILRDDVVESYSTGGDSLKRVAHWKYGDLVVVFDQGHSTVTYSKADSILSLNTDSSAASQTVKVPLIDSLFALPAEEKDTMIVGVTPNFSLVHINYSSQGFTLLEESSLPLTETLKFILPVDPMSWSHYPQRKTEDTLLSITTSGELAFWRHDRREGWTSTGRVRTGRTDIRLARYSSAKKTVLVTSTPAGEELTIWDSQESEFSRGLEFTQLFEPEEIVNDLDWSSTYQSHSILAVGFARHILIMCEQRMTYFEQEPAWRVCHKIDITLLTSHSIIDSIWLSGGSLLVGAGHQMFLYGRSEQSASTEAVPRTNYLLEYVLQQNAPLVDFHPQVLLQCLLWGRVELVKDIIVKLANAAAVAERQDSPVAIKIDPQVVEDFWSSDHITVKDPSTQIKKQYQLLFDHEDSSDDGISFTRPVITRLLEFLVKNPMPELTQLENVHLSILIQTTLEIDEQRRALDANGLRYLISMRLFYLINKRAASVPETATLSAGISNKLSGRGRIRFRDIVWAYHSETQEIILAASSAACGNKMTWNDARALGVFLWLHGHEQLKAQMEIVARNQYMADDSRDPTACSLLYFALRKIKLVHGLWKQAAWHPEQKIMLKFLSKNFDEPQSKTAALKNAFALLAKQRFEYAAAFFLLGGSLKDAVNVCLKHLKDFQLAVAIARVIEQGDDGPILRDILERTVIPTAFREGNRWLGSWAFWVLRRRDLAVRILVTPLVELAPTLPMPVSEIGDNHYDDPSLALLFSQIRSMTLQTVKGTSEISGRTEFRFVMQIARVFCRMGCHVLALALVRSWPFARPITSLQSSGTNEASATEIIPRAEPVGPTRPDFALRGSRRRSQIAIDMDISGLPPTRRGSPSPEGRSESKPVVEAGEMLPEADSADAIARHAALGNLMRSARKNISTPEFDMDSFFPTSTSTISPLPAVSEQPAQESVPSSKQPEIKTEETAAGTNLMKAKAKAHAPVVVPEFDMNNFF